MGARERGEQTETLPTPVDPTPRSVATPRSAEPPMPSRIGRYVVLRRLGAGGMGVVYLAVDPRLQRRVAVKLVGADPHRVPVGAHARLRREAQALARLAHPDVVAVYDVGTHDDRVFVAMELVHGETLRTWLRARTRSPSEILAVFERAGGGLSAAHAVGLVHRDFKPDNVMIRDDGGVRVLDFGLAILREPELAPTDDEVSDDHASLVETRLTMTGVVLGTPAYMAPEQHAGRGADARSDQFSFCVALFEAFYGMRPFRGRDHKALRRSIARGELPDPPPGCAVPRRIHRVLARGLSADPRQRFASMEALLRALRGRSRRARWRIAGAGSVLAATAILLAGAHDSETATAPCERTADAMESIWGPTEHARVRSALRASKVSYAEGTWSRVQTGLDDYARRWAGQRRETCEAGRDTGTDVALDLRMACLDRRAASLAATVDVLGSADGEVIRRAIVAVASLPSLEPCRDDVALLAEVPPPDDPELAAEVEAARDDLARAEAEYAAGRYAEVGAAIDGLVARAEATGYEPVLAEALLRQGLVRVQQTSYAGAEASLVRAYEVATASHHDRVAMVAASQLIGLTGYLQARTDEGLRWSRHAQAAEQRIDPAPRERARLVNGIGAVEFRAGHLAEAGVRYEEAIALVEGVDDLAARRELASSLNNLGDVQSLQGDQEAAAATLERAVETLSDLLGPEHPAVAIILANLGNTRFEQGRIDEALRLHRRALRIRRDALGPKSDYVASSLTNLGPLETEAGDLDAAAAHLEEALAIRRETKGPDHPDTARIRNNLGEVYREQGRIDDALAQHQRALWAWESLDDGSHFYTAYVLTNLGEDLLAAGRPHEAVAMLDKALAVPTTDEVDPAAFADTRFAMARALTAAGKSPRRARALALEARERFAAAGGRFERQLIEVDAWLAAAGG